MAKQALHRPTLVLLYGFPGAGKTFFARQLCDELQAAHVHDDRLRHELFEQPRHDQQEDEIIDNLMQYMTEEFLQAGISVVFDTNVTRLSERRALRDFARKLKAEPLLVWLQIDIESAFMRVGKRDRRRSDDRYTSPLDRDSFERIIHNMQNPAPTEDYVVLSGKHTFRTQMQMLMKKLLEMNLIESGSGNQHVVKPGLVNLVPGRVDASRRNITIR